MPRARRPARPIHALYQHWLITPLIGASAIRAPSTPAFIFSAKPPAKIDIIERWPALHIGVFNRIKSFADIRRPAHQYFGDATKLSIEHDSAIVVGENIDSAGLRAADALVPEASAIASVAVIGNVTPPTRRAPRRCALPAASHHVS